MRMHRLFICCLHFSLAGPAGAFERLHQIDVLIVTTTEGVGYHHVDVDGVKSIFTQAQDEFARPGGSVNDPDTGEAMKVEIRIRPIIVDPQNAAHLEQDIGAMVATDVSGVTNTVVCYLKLHGACDSTGAHYLLTHDLRTNASEYVPRTVIIDALRMHQADLTVLLTDSCSSGPYAPGEVTTAARTFPRALFLDLFVSSRGVIDVNSSTCDPKNGVYQQAWMIDHGKALFSQALIKSLTSAEESDVAARLKAIDVGVADAGGERVATSGDRNPPAPHSAPNGRYSWDEFFRRLSVETSQGFLEMRSVCQSRLDEFLRPADPAAPARRPMDAKEFESCMKVISQVDQTPQSRSPLPTAP